MTLNRATSGTDYKLAFNNHVAIAFTQKRSIKKSAFLFWFIVDNYKYLYYHMLIKQRSLNYMEKRDKATTLRVSSKELERMQEKAEEKGLPLATYIRMASLKGFK